MEAPQGAVQSRVLWVRILYSIIASFQLLYSISELFPAVSRNFRIEPKSKIIVTQEGSHCLI
jgi:hypothetical protein